MKKYFLFDDEPLNGADYVRRIIVGSILMLFLIGFWILAATGYKRAGAFGWKKEFRIIAAIFIPILAVSNALGKSKGYSDSPINLFDIITIVVSLFHFVMVVKNGNKNKVIIDKIFEVKDKSNLGFFKIELHTKFDDYNNLDFQIRGYVNEEFQNFNLSKKGSYILDFYTFEGVKLKSFVVPNRVLNREYISTKDDKKVFIFNKYINLTKAEFNQIVTCELIYADSVF